MENDKIEQTIIANAFQRTVIKISSGVNINIYPTFGEFSFELEDLSLPHPRDRFYSSARLHPLYDTISTIKEIQSQKLHDIESIVKKLFLHPGPCMFNPEYQTITSTRADRFEVTPEIQKRLTVSSRFVQGTDLNNIDKHQYSVDFSNAIIRTDYGEFQGYEDLSDVAYFSVDCDEENISKKDGAISNAIIGGIIAGGVGAIIGGASADTIHKKNITKVSVKISFIDSPSRIITINIYSRDKWSQHHTPQSALEIANRLKALIDSAKDTKTPNKKFAHPLPVSQNDLVDKLTKITEMFQSGLLSAEEFSISKKKLLDS